MTWDFSADAEFEQTLAWVRDFVETEIYPLEVLPLSPDDVTRLTAPLKQTVRQKGLWAAHLPVELGGSGLTNVQLALLYEILGRSHYAPPIFGNQAPDSGNAEILARFGTEEQKQAYLWPLLDGTIHSCFSMTEPGAGADPTLLTSRAVKQSDGNWILNGHKWFSSHAVGAHFLLVMAVTDPEAPPRNGMSVFIVPADSPGVTVRREIFTMGGNPGDHGHYEVTYEDVHIPSDHLLGTEGEGFVIAQSRLGPGRIHHCMRWLGQAERALDMLCERALSRYTHGSLLSEKQTIQNWIADSWVEIQASRLLTLQAAWKMDQVGATGARAEIAAVKFFGAKVLHDVIDRALQIHGALGVSTDMPLETMYRNARSARIYDGPDEVHRVTLARQVLHGYAAVDGPPSEHIPTRRVEAAAKLDFPLPPNGP